MVEFRRGGGFRAEIFACGARGDVHRRRGSLPSGLIGRQWSGPSGCSRVVMPTRRWRGSLLRSVLLHSNNSWWCNYSPPSFAFRSSVTWTRSGYALQTPDSHSRSRSLSSPPPPFFTVRFFASENRQGVTPRSLPPSSPSPPPPPPSPYVCITGAGETKESLELGQSKFFGDPNAPWRKSGREERKRIHECTDPPSDSDGLIAGVDTLFAWRANTGWSFERSHVKFHATFLVWF